MLLDNVADVIYSSKYVVMEEHEYKLGFHEGMSIRIIKMSRERVLGVSFQEKLFNGVVS